LGGGGGGSGGGGATVYVFNCIQYSIAVGLPK
jgi:hypothetical protein